MILVYSMRPSETTHLMLFDLLIVGEVHLIGRISVSTRSLLHGNRTLCGVYKRLLGCQVELAELMYLNCKHHHA